MSEITIGTTVYLVNRVDGPYRLCRGVVDDINKHTGKAYAHVQWDSPKRCESHKAVLILTTSPIVAISSRNDLDSVTLDYIIKDAQDRGILEKG